MLPCGGAAGAGALKKSKSLKASCAVKMTGACARGAEGEEEDDEDPINVDEITGLDWKTGTTIGPKDFKSLPRATTIMPQFNSKYFDTPCSSFFLSFLLQCGKR